MAKISSEILNQAFQYISTAKQLSELYEENFKLVSKYVHATSRGHEAIQVATGMLLESQDYLSAYYRDDALLLSIGVTPYELMLQLLAKKDDPFSGGRTYYSHPSLRREGMPKIPHQSSATGMQAIPSTGVALGMWYRSTLEDSAYKNDDIVLCSLGDACITEGEVSEAVHMAALKQLPIVYLVQDNEWDISAHASEIRAQDASEWIQGYPTIKAMKVDGSDFGSAYKAMKEAIEYARKNRAPVWVHSTVPLLNHHTSGVRKEWYRDDLEVQAKRDPYPQIIDLLMQSGASKKEIQSIEKKIRKKIEKAFKKALEAPDPRPEDLHTHIFAPFDQEESGVRAPEDSEEIVMVDCALLAIQEIMEDDERCVFYGQDVGGRLGGVFREAATLAQKFGDNRVFNTPIQEAFIVGSSVGMSAYGLKPIVEVQFADYIWPGLNQLFTEVSRSCYLSDGKWPVSMILRVPIGAYGSGGPYHSSSVESVLANIHGIKIAYPSNGADLKGLLNCAYHDPNPCVILEHKGLYWSKVKGTERAKSILPGRNYRYPFGKARVHSLGEESPDITVVCYGMGVHWSLNACEALGCHAEVVDLVSIAPLDLDTVYDSVRKTGKCLIVTEEPSNNGFARSIAAHVGENCFESLDAPVRIIGSENTPAIPLNSVLEQTMIPNISKVKEAIEALLGY